MGAAGHHQQRLAVAVEHQAVRNRPDLAAKLLRGRDRGLRVDLIGLAAELPAAVLADLLAIDIVTATRWAGYAKRDWNDYLAVRRADAQQLPAAPQR
jgi:hypothetical protein